MAVLTGTALLISGLAGAAGSAAVNVYAQHKQAEAANHAADLQTSASDKQLAFAEDQAKLDQKNWQQAQDFNLAQYNAKEARLAPYRNIGVNANSTLAKFIGGNNVVPISYVPPPVKLPPLESTTTVPPSTANDATGVNNPVMPGSSPDISTLSDPNAWMSLVGDDSKLTSFVQQGLGPKADGQLVSYYVGKIKGQPGANPTEQAGSAKYWLDKMQKDPKVTGQAPAPGAAPLTNAGSTMPTQPYGFTSPTSSIAPAAPPQLSSLQRFVRTPALA